MNQEITDAIAWADRYAGDLEANLRSDHWIAKHLRTLIAAARAAAQPAQTEPDWWVYEREGFGPVASRDHWPDDVWSRKWTETPLYAAAQPAQIPRYVRTSYAGQLWDKDHPPTPPAAQIPREPTAYELAPTCIGFTNGCHCVGCMGPESWRESDAPPAALPEGDAEELRVRLQNETRIVDRIWDQLGRPDHAELKG